MSTGFTIDDVRDTLTSDVTRFLGRIEATARDLAEGPFDLESTSHVIPLFQQIGDHGHAIHGTTSLVDVHSLASSSELLERLALIGRDDLARAARLVSRAREIAIAIAGGAGDMLAMLSLELDDRSDEAAHIAASWRMRAEEALAMHATNASALVAAPPPPAPPPPPPPAPKDAWSFDDGWSEADLAEPPAAAPVAPVVPSVAESRVHEFSFAGSSAESAVDVDTAAIDVELALIFEEEARETLDALTGQLAALAARPDDRNLSRELERSYHTLKGAAATVGLAAISEQAAELQLRVEAIFEAAGSATPALVAELVEATATLRRAVGLAPVAVPMPPARPSSQPSLAAVLAVGIGDSDADEMHGVFLGEARAICVEATALVRRLPAEDAREELRKLVHRLKGSAMVAMHHAVAREATALHDMLEENVDAGVVSARLAAIASLVGDDATRRRTDERMRVAVPVPDAEIEAGFRQECTELLETLDRGVVGLERSAHPKDDLGRLLGAYHTLKGSANAIGLRPTGDLVHQVEDFVENLQRATIIPPLSGIISLLLQLHSELRRHLDTMRAGYVEVTPGRWEDRLRRILAGESRATNMPSDSARSKLGEGSDASGPSGSLDHGDRKHIRVPIDRLDALMNLAGELVINRSRLLSRIDTLQHQQADLGRSSRRLTEIVEVFREEHEFSMVPRNSRTVARGGQWGAFSELELDRYEDVNILARTLAESSTDMQDVFSQLGGGLSALVDDSDALGTIIAGMQSEITRARMVPLGSLFSRLQLPIRDAAQREQRDVRIVTEGEDVHLDKTIVDALLQPMLHLVRNAVSHGLETPARRTAAGKPAAGTIRLRARQELGQIAVEVIDDGGGLDLVKLHARGVAMGIIAADVPLDDPKVRDLIFVPGVTTSANAGSVSGRGVGCDVVRRAVERLNGSIRVSTVPGRNTSFVITLPVTLAISRALLVRHGEQTFAVPLNFTDRILDAQEQQVVESAGRRRIELDDGFAMVRSFGELVGSPTPAKGPVVILRVGDQRLVVQVDAVIGQEEIVVKGLGSLLTGHPLFAGVTIRGTGEIVLIVDVPSVVEAALGTHEVRGAQPALGPDVSEPVPVAEPADAGRVRVLFVDDSVSVRKVAERALQALGVEVTLAVDGVDALEKLHARPFDLVFTDLEMPRMHGYELIRELRFLPAFRSLPVVVVTSRSGKKHREEAYALGATHYLTKPFSPQSLEAALAKHGGPRAAGLGSGVKDAGGNS